MLKVAENIQARGPAEIAGSQKRVTNKQSYKDKFRRTKRKPKEIYILMRNVKEAMKVQYQKVIKAWQEKSSLSKVSVNGKDALYLTSWQENVKNYVNVVKSLQCNMSMKHQSWILDFQ